MGLWMERRQEAGSHLCPTPAGTDGCACVQFLECLLLERRLFKFDSM